MLVKVAVVYIKEIKKKLFNLLCAELTVVCTKKDKIY